MKVIVWWDDGNGVHFHKKLEMPTVFPGMELFLVVIKNKEIEQISFYVTSFMEYREHGDLLIAGIEANDHDSDELVQILADSDWAPGEP